MSNDGTQLFVGTKWAGTFNGQTSACQGWRDKQCLLLFSLDTSDGSFNWTKWPDQAEMQSLHVDASDNIYVLGRSYNGNKWPDEYPKHLYFGQNLIYKYNSSGVEQWKRQYGSSERRMYGQNNESLSAFHVTPSGQIYIGGMSGFNSHGLFYGLSLEGSAGSQAVLFKADGNNTYMGTDYFTLTLNQQPTADVTFTVTSPDTGEATVALGGINDGMYKNRPESFHCLSASCNSGVSNYSSAPYLDNSSITFREYVGWNNWNTPYPVHIQAVQDNLSDGDQTLNFNVTTSSTDANWNGLSFTVPVTVVDQNPSYPLDQPNLTGATGGVQQVSLTWNAVARADYYRIFWKKSSTNNYDSFNVNNSNTYDGVIKVDNVTNYVHAGLSSGNPYHYTIVAGKVGYEHAETVRSNSRQASSVTDFTTETLGTDNDPDLMVYYDFDAGGGGNLVNKSPVTAGSYNLTASGSTIVSTGSRFAGNTAAYFDADDGYAYNNDFNDTNITQLSNTGNFTISAWVYPDQDMVKFASIMATGDSTNKNTGAFQMSNTNHTPNKIGMFAQNTDIKLESSATSNNTWYHAVFVKEQNGIDNGTGRFYLNAVEVDNATNFKTGFKKLKIGINRVTKNSWKGYIDEFKVYRRALNATEVNNLYNNDTP